MLFSALLLVFLFAVTFFQAMHGFYSALIMLVLTLCSTAIAVGTFEWVAANWAVKLWPEYAHALALAGTFALPLAVLRALFDQIVRRGILLPVWLERAGGGVCGLITGLICTGMLGLSITSLPWDRGSFLTFARIDFQEPDIASEEQTEEPEPQDPQITHNLLFMPDRFAIATGAYLADHVFGAPPAAFRDTHPDVVEAMAWNNAVPMEMQRYAPEGSISLVEGGRRKVDYVYFCTFEGRLSENDPPVGPKSGKEFWAYRIEILPEARRQYSFDAFTPRQIRLVGRTRPGGPLEQFYPIAIEAPDGSGKHMHTMIFRHGNWPVVDMSFLPKEGSNNQVEVVYELPQGFRPEYIEYKLGARAEIPSGDVDVTGGSGQSAGVSPSEASGENSTVTADSGGGTGRPGSSTGVTSEDATVPSVNRGGRVRSVTTRVGRSGFTDGMPVTLKKYSTLKDTQIRGEVVEQGHLVAYADEQEQGGSAPVSYFKVPDDMRLLQLNVMNLKAGSLFGKAMQQAVVTVQNYTVMDDKGERYQLCGKIAAAIVGDREVIEVQYFPEQVGSIGGVGPFSIIKERDLDKDETLILLFLVKPGVKIVEFSTGGQANRADDLKGEDLISPE